VRDFLSKNEKEKRVTVSIVTATFNAVNHLPKLIESLRGQTDKDFEWVVADGASTDGTLELLQSVSGINMVISSQPDFGIYDALNRAIKISSGEYYIVCGADDFFYDDAIGNFRRAIVQSGADIVVANAMYGQRCMKVKKGPSWLFGQFAFIAAHTLATAFRKNLHGKFGFYSRWYPIAADQFFVTQVCKGGASRYEGNFVAGEIGRGGVSGVDQVGNAVEVFRMQLASGNSVTLQFMLLMIRLLK
jgi:glycosyltransferase involved in cell wall biosynthesis